MKRFVLLLALLCCVAANAQVRQQTYGDTMFARLDSFYYVPWWIVDDWVNLNNDTVAYTTRFIADLPLEAAGPNREGMFRYHHTDYPIKITGIACAGYSGSAFYVPGAPEYLDTTFRPEYLVLWAQEGDTIVNRGELLWKLSDPCRYITIPHLVDDDYCCWNNHPDTVTVEIREYYFEKPITVNGDFYVGGTNRSFYPLDEDGEHLDDYTMTYYYCMNTMWSHCQNCACKRHRYLRKRYNPFTVGAYDDFVDLYTMSLVIPLYEVLPTAPQGGNSCVRPTGLRLADMTPRDGVAYISWDDLEHHTSWDVALGDTLFETIRHELLPLIGLRQGETYSVAVRAHCQFSDTLFYSDWSDTLTFTLSDDGIRVISDSRGQIAVFPNPTTGDVTVDCGSLKVERIELLDLQGRVLMREEHSLFPNPYTLSLKDVPTGTYLIRIHTAEGPFTRRVVKE